MASHHDSQESFGSSIADADLVFLLGEFEANASIPLPLETTSIPDNDSTANVMSSQLVPSSDLSAEDIIDYGAPGPMRELMRDRCQVDTGYARGIIDKYDRQAQGQGWCRVVPLKESKENGYVQVSWAGVNKFAVLQEVVVWANGSYVRAGEDASHLCHQKKCLNLQHIIPEEKQRNQARKGCRVWVDCNHCEKKIFVCFHEPPCIKYCAGYRDHEHFLSEGICKNVNDETPVGV